MKIVMGFIVGLITAPVVAQENVTFNEFEAVTQAMATYSNACRREIVNGHSEQCERFRDYLNNRYTPLSHVFTQRLRSEGILAYDGADNVRMQMHSNRQTEITTNLIYITEMMRY